MSTATRDRIDTATLPAVMYRCRITAPNGATSTSELNRAAIDHWQDRGGWTVTILGGTRFTIVLDGGER